MPRTALVEELLRLSRPLDVILRELANFAFDSEPLVMLERRHLAAILDRFVAGELDEAAVESWADAIEMRDDVGLPDDDDVVRDVLFELANPLLTEPLLSTRAVALGRLLASKQ